MPETIKSVNSIAKYLKKNGWKCSQSTIHRHYHAGFLKSKKDGTFKIEEVEMYANKHLKHLGEIPKRNNVIPDEIQIEKRTAEARKLAAQARHWECKAKILENDWIEKSEFERALAARAAIFKNDLENFIRMHSSAMVRIVQGNDLLIPDLIDFWLENTEKFLDRYARAPKE